MKTDLSVNSATLEHPASALRIQVCAQLVNRCRASLCLSTQERLKHIADRLGYNAFPTLHQVVEALNALRGAPLLRSEEMPLSWSSTA
eukprot:1333157-Amphidinium_carterae.1